MKDFGNYTRIIDTQAQYELDYINKNNIDSTNMYRFQIDLFNQLVNDRRFEEAYEYGKKFKRTDPKENANYNMSLYSLRQNGRKESYFYSQLQHDSDMMHQSEFYRNVFVNNGLNTLVGRESMEDNPYAKQFIDAKRRIGSELDAQGNITKEATKLSVTFKPKGSSWFLTDWITGTDEDIDYLELFYNQSGLNEQQLKANGIAISKKDGNTTITFEKSSPIANQILYGLDFEESYHSSESKGLFGNVVALKQFIADNAPVIIPYDIDGNKIEYKYMTNESKARQIIYLDNLRNFKTMIDDAKHTNTKAEEFVSKEDGYYKGFAIAIPEEELKNNGIDQALHILEPSDMEIYSNAYNEEDITALMPIQQTSEEDNDNNNKVAILEYVKANADRAHFAYASYGDKTGILISVEPYKLTDTEAQSLSKDMNVADAYKGREIRVFIPGLGTEAAERAINNNSEIRAQRESNDMQKYGYNYTLYNNRTIAYDGNGSYIYQDDYTKIPQDDAINLIHKTQLIEDSEFLKYEHINKDNKIYNYSAFDNHAKAYAISAAMSLHPDILKEEYSNNSIIFVDKQGNKITIKDIFNKRGLGSAILDKYAQSMDYKTLEFYKDCFDVYMAMINDVNNYK